MWMIFAGDSYLSNEHLIYDDQLPGDLSQLYAVLDPELALELNKIGSLTFTIYPSHPAYNHINKLKTQVSVYLDGHLYWVGRILNDTVGALNQRVIQCEEYLSVLHDSVQRPYEYPGDIVDPAEATPAHYLSYLLSQHNEQVPDKPLLIGEVTVVDPNDYIARSDNEYTDTYKLITDGLLKPLGGYIVPRYTADGVFVDYLADLSAASDQPVQLGMNLLDISTERRGEDTYTAILPLGARSEDGSGRLTLEALEDGPVTGYTGMYKLGDLVYSSTAESSYGGRIVKVETWDSVTDAGNLLTKSAARLSALIQMPSVISITAADASAATIGAGYAPWHIGQTVTLVDGLHASEHGLLPTYLIERINVRMTRPQDARLQLGGVSASLSETTAAQRDDAIRVAVNAAALNQAQALRQAQQLLMAELRLTEQGLSSVVAGLELIVNGGTDTNGTPIEGLVDGLANATGNITELAQRADGVDLTVSQLLSGYNDITTHFGFSAEGLTINKNDDEVYAIYSNDAATYKRDNTDGAGNIISSETFATIGSAGVKAVRITAESEVSAASGVFRDAVSVGDWAWTQESDGSLTLKRST